MLTISGFGDPEIECGRLLVLQKKVNCFRSHILREYLSLRIHALSECSAGFLSREPCPPGQGQGSDLFNTEQALRPITSNNRSNLLNREPLFIADIEVSVCITDIIVNEDTN